MKHRVGWPYEMPSGASIGLAFGTQSSNVGALPQNSKSSAPFCAVYGRCGRTFFIAGRAVCLWNLGGPHL